jgi:cytochrome c1
MRFVSVRFARIMRVLAPLAALIMLLAGRGRRAAPAASPPETAPIEDTAPRAWTLWRIVVLPLGLLALLMAGGAWRVVSQEQQEKLARTLAGGDSSRAPMLLTRYGCGGCHTIPGVPGADGRVAAPLQALRERVFIGGGVARNTAENLVAWIVDPESFSPRSAMPRTGITEAEARDVATYLYAH